MVQHYKEIMGWLKDDEATELDRLASRIPLKRILEIGTFCGRSASVLAQHADTLICIDLFPDNQKFCGSEAVVESPLKNLWRNMKKSGLENKIVSIKWNSLDMLPKMEGKFGMVFVDGGHTMRDILPNTIWAWEHLADGGILAWHDYDNPEWQDVKLVVDMLCSKWGKKPNIVGQVASITK